jgi:hypothetical protein
MNKSMSRIMLLAFLSIFIFSNALATQIYFNPQNQIFNIGDTLNFGLMADIDSADAIMGFGFDLSFDGGNTFISGPGASGSALTFDNFNPNAALGFSYDPFFDSDGDTISGFLGPFDPDVSGNGVNLGTFSFTAFALSHETIQISADDIGSIFSTEGLVPGFTSINFESFLPNDAIASVTPVAIASVTPVPLPPMLVLFSTGLAALVGLRKKFFR